MHISCDCGQFKAQLLAFPKNTPGWSATCCNSPIANTPAGIPWVGIFHQAFTRSDESYPARLGSVRSRIHGLHARPGAPFEIAPKIGFKAMMTVMPFIIKGKILKKHSRSPFFKEDNRTPITEPRVLEA